MKNMSINPSKEKVDENAYGQMLQNIKELDEELTAMNLEFGEYLYIIKHNKLYNFSGFEHWNDFLKDLGVPISEAETLIKVFITFPPKARFCVPFRRLKKMIKCFDEDLIEKAISLPYYEFIDEVNMKKGKKSKEVCDHENYEIYGKCTKCGSWNHIREENTRGQDSRQTEKETQKEDKIPVSENCGQIVEPTC